MKRQALDWEKIFANHVFDKGLICRLSNDHLKVNIMKTSNPIRKQAKNTSRDLTKDMQVAKKPTKTRSATLAKRKMQIKSTMRHHSHLSKWLK